MGRILQKLTAVIFATLGICAYAWGMEEDWGMGEGLPSEHFNKEYGAVYLIGGTFLRVFPYEPVPYDDYAVEVHYYEHADEDIVNIAYWGEAESIHLLKKRYLAGDDKLQFFALTDATTGDGIGYGSCSYKNSPVDPAKPKKESCEYTFLSGSFNNWGDSWVIRVEVDFTTGTFRSYALPQNGESGFQIHTEFE